MLAGQGWSAWHTPKPAKIFCFRVDSAGKRNVRLKAIKLQIDNLQHHQQPAIKPPEKNPRKQQSPGRAKVSESQVPDLFSVRDRRIVVVGGTSGIGQAAASYLSRQGANITITGRRASGAAIAERIGAGFVAMDVADNQSVQVGFAEISATPIDCLILNAGIKQEHGEIANLDIAVFEQMMDVNTLGTVRALAAGVGAMRSGGSVVVTSSPAGLITVGGLAAYSASKAALNMLVRTWSLELGPKGIRVNAILPGIVESEMAPAGSPEVEGVRRMTANGVFRRPEEMAPVFQFLASDASVTLTGSLVGAHDGISVGYSAEVMRYLSVTSIVRAV